MLKEQDVLFSKALWTEEITSVSFSVKTSVLWVQNTNSYHFLKIPCWKKYLLQILTYHFSV